MSSYLFRLLHLDKILTGTRAFTVQLYTEANTKNGTQFAASSYFTNITAGEILDVLIVTGVKPVIIKAQYIATRDGSDVLSDFYKNPVVSSMGTNVSSIITNQSDINPLPTTIQLYGTLPTNAAAGNFDPDDATKPVITSPGTKIQPTLVTLGAQSIGGGQSNTNTLIGLDYVLAPNTTYLFRRTCRGATASMFSYSTWYEGGPDLPRAEGEL